MSLLILNGSPKSKSGNSEIFIHYFVSSMVKPYEIGYIYQSKINELVEHIAKFDTVIFVMPLYVHSVPGKVIKLFEQLKKTDDHKVSFGFIIQSGFMESSQSRFAISYLKLQCRSLHYNYIGTVVKGGAAGVYMMPETMNKKLFKHLRELGQYFERTQYFDEKIIEILGNPYKLTKRQVLLQRFLTKIGLSNLFWNKMLKDNHAFDHRFDQPYRK